MNVSLTPELEQMVEGLVASGDYKSASEVVRHALRLLSREREVHEARLEALRAQLDPALDEYERGESIPGPVAVAQAHAEFRRLTERSAGRRRSAG